MPHWTSPIPNLKNFRRPRGTLQPSLNQQKSFIIRWYRGFCRPHGQLVAQTGDGWAKVRKMNQRSKYILYAPSTRVSFWIWRLLLISATLVNFIDFFAGASVRGCFERKELDVCEGISWGYGQGLQFIIWRDLRGLLEKSVWDPLASRDWLYLLIQ